jgi:dipeptidyl-peptidase 4
MLTWLTQTPKSLILVALFCVTVNSQRLQGFQASADDVLMTVAESSNFTATATGQQVLDFLKQLAHQWEGSELHTLGTTVEGRPVQALVVEPTIKLDQRPLTVLILGGIHPGECDGKESLLAYMRDLSVDANPQWYQSLRLIFVPNFNADGDARRGKLHRPGQAGPADGMGIRENALGLDLNRDFIKLETPEVRSIVAAYNQFNVDVMLDLHTTNGSLHRYPITYDIPHNPAVLPELDHYLRREFLPEITERMSKKSFETFYYGNFDRAHRRWESYGFEPRYSTEYMGLRGKIGILVESYSYASYETRFLANYAFIDEVLHKLVADQERLVAAIDAGQQLNQPGAIVPIAGELAMTADDVTVLGYQSNTGQPPTGPYDDKSASRYQAHNYQVQLWNRAEPKRVTKLPVAYAIPAQHAWAVSRLLRHGLQVLQLNNHTPVDADVAKISSIKQGTAFQGHNLKSLTVEWSKEQHTLVAGTYLIPASGALGRLAAMMLEPESDENLATWNFFDPYLQEGENFPVVKLQELPANCQPVHTITRGEVISLSNTLQPGSNVNAPGIPLLEAPSWLPAADSIEYAQRQHGQLVAVEAATGSARRLPQLRQLESKLAELQSFDAAQAKSAAAANSFWRTGSQQALIEHKNDLFFYDSKPQVVRQLTHTPELSELLAELSPTGNSVAYVRDNNLWVVNCETTEQKQLTEDGSPELLNGILDWVYQEELYGRGKFKAFWWSPDGQQIAYLQLDQSAVPKYVVSDSISFAQSLEHTRYPKAGQANPIVRVWLVDVHTGQRKEVNVAKFPDADRLVGRVSWSPDNQLWLQVFNRVQNRQELVKVDPQTGNAQTILKEESSGWLEIRGTPIFLSNGNFLWLSDLPSGRTHLYRVDPKSGEKTAMTSGDWDVAEFRSLSQDERFAFVSGHPGNPIETHLVAVDLINGNYRQVTSAPGTHSVSVDPTGSYFIDTFSNVTTPPTTSLYTIDGQLLRVLSAAASDRHEFYQIQTPRLTTIPARDGLPLQTMLLLPVGVPAGQENSEIANSSEQRNPRSTVDSEPHNAKVASTGPQRLPVLIHVYGGPQAPTVTNNWQQGNYWWHRALCTQGFAVVLCDNRSARGRGVADTWKVRGDLGRVELQDLEDAVSWVKQQPWADPDRIGVWGWSYGGYFTAYAMTHSQLFKAGISGAPVTDWRNYDSIYTERYMDLPAINEKGYQSSSVVNAAANLHGRLMIIHGEQDDNVHISNTLQLVDALQNAGKQFDLMIYPKARHGVVDPQKKYQMYQMMTEFLEQHLK